MWEIPKAGYWVVETEISKVDLMDNLTVSKWDFELADSWAVQLVAEKERL